MNQPNTSSADAIQPQPLGGGERFEDRQAGAAHFAQKRQAEGSIAGDILYGAEAIAEFLYGERRHRRRVYNLIDGARLPHFRLGMGICARRSVLMDWIAGQEEGRVADGAKPLK